LLVIASLLAGLLALLMALGAGPLVSRIAMAVRAMDYPGGRRVQHEAIPRMGGIAIAIGIAAGAVGPILLLSKNWGGSDGPWQLATLALTTGLVFLAGVAEDVIGLSCIQRLLLQVAAACGVVAAGWSLQLLYIPFWGDIHFGFSGTVLTVIWIVGVTNAINLLDGLDGLAGGVAAIIATTFLILAWIQGDALTLILMSATVGACIGFLRHNWEPAKIYMGDSGSLLLGFLLAVLSLHASIKGAATVAILTPILALGLPVIDTLLVMGVRFVEEPHGGLLGRCARMFQADRNHVHHLLTRIAPGRKQAVLAIYFVCAWFCVMALGVAVSRSAVLGIVLVLVEGGVVLLMRALAAFRRMGRLSVKQRREVRGSFFEQT
jgi:UDP-GlcNAc:undecaprenyl-phosphate/decaprenyl-phosphate GlcNAc-1-phosphate transferase